MLDSRDKEERILFGRREKDEEGAVIRGRLLARLLPSTRESSQSNFPGVCRNKANIVPPGTLFAR